MFQKQQAEPMSFLPTLAEQIARVRADLRMGVPVVITSPDGDALVQAAETLTPERLKSALELDGETVLTVTARRAETLKLAAYDGATARILLPKSATYDWIQAIADPADDLRHPMKGPLKAQRDGDAAIHALSIQLCKDARLLPSTLVTRIEHQGAAFATKNMLSRIPLLATQNLIGQTAHYNDIVHARLPMQVSEQGRLHVFRPNDGGEEHYAIEVGKVSRDTPVLTRLHSACFTGDLMGSLKCDCGPQLRAALAQMGESGSGILLYLNQEGRGIGLANKMRAYSLQDQGFDTVEANHRLGFEDDERDFRIGAAILEKLGIKDIKLLTNNPAKLAMMEKNGIHVSARVPLKVGENPHNIDYLATKAAKSGHML